MSARPPSRTSFRMVSALLAAAATISTTTLALAQPVDPYGDPPPEVDPDLLGPSTPPDGAVEGDADIDEAVAASLVARARELIATEQWADAQQLLGEAMARSPGGAAAAEAKPLLDDVNARLGISTDVVDPVDPVDGQIGDPIDDPVDPYKDDNQIYDDEVPGGSTEKPAGGRRFMVHAVGIGAVIGGFIGDAATADLDDLDENFDGDPHNEEDAGGIFAGALLGALGGLVVGAAFRNSPWMTRDDVVTIDSFAAFGMVGSLSLAGLMQPVEGEGYSVNAIIGTLAGTATGLALARKRDISARRMGRIDLWAAAGALTPWVLYAAADGDGNDDAQVAGFFSCAGLVGGIWLGFRTTRSWDRDKTVDSYASDAPGGLVRRSSTGVWSLDAPTLRVHQNPALGPQLGVGASVDVVGVRW